MSARIVLTDMDGEKHIQEYLKVTEAREAMHFMSSVIGRSLRTERPMILGVGTKPTGPNIKAYPEFSIRTDMVKSLRLLEDEEDEIEGEEATGGVTTDDPDWWKK